MSSTESSNALPVNYRLDEYVIQSVLGQGGFGITYLARDRRLGALVAIKEYFPQAYAARDRTNTIHPNAGSVGDVENYRWGLQEFLKEARALAQFKHANIVRVLRFLEANGTAYMVMEYEEGESLSSHLAHHGGFLSEPVLLNIFLPVLTGLQAVHDTGLLHLDIKPDNIYLRRSGPPMIIDFGAARQRSGSDRSEKVALTPCYAALEQYPGHGDLGPWSDVYSMGATLYRCITGKEPVDSRDREQGLKKLRVDQLIPATRFERPHYSAHIRSCVDQAMVLDAEKRPRSAFALQNGLMGKDMNAARPAAAAGNAYSRGAGFMGVVETANEGKRRRFIPRGPIERLLVFSVFLAVMIVAPVRIMLALGQLTEEEVYDRVGNLQVSTVEFGKQATRYVEENLLGVKRPPEYVPPPALSALRHVTAPRTEVEPAVLPFDIDKKLAATLGVSAPVLALAFLQDGQRLAVALDDGTVELRNAGNGAMLRTLAAANGKPGIVAASPDGKRLAFGDENYGIQLWDMEKNIFLGEVPGHLDAIVALAFSPDGKLLASASSDQTAAVWDVESGRQLLDLSKPGSEPRSLAFAPEGGMLAVGDAGGGIRYWNLRTLRDIAYVPTRDLPITALAYSPDGKSFAVGGEQGFLSLWDVGGKRDDRPLAGAPDTVHALAFTPDSKWLLVAGSEGTLQLWSVETAQLAHRYEGGNHQTYALALAPEGKEIAAAGIDNQLTFWR